MDCRATKPKGNITLALNGERLELTNILTKGKLTMGQKTENTASVSESKLSGVVRRFTGDL